MLRNSVVLIALFAFGMAHAKDFSQWVTQVRSIEKDRDDNFQLVFDRTARDGNDQHIVLTDNDGIATLAVTQLMLVDRIRDLKAEKKDISMDSLLGAVFSEGERKIISIQHDAIDKLIAGLEAVDGEKRLLGTDLSAAEALKLAKQLRGRFFAKMPWTLKDIEKMGTTIQKLAGGGGPYPADYTQNGNTRTYQVFLKDPKDPKENFLSGAVVSGFFAPSQWVEGPSGFSKSHLWISGDVSKVGRNYNPSGTHGNGSNFIKGVHP